MSGTLLSSDRMLLLGSLGAREQGRLSNRESGLQ